MKNKQEFIEIAKKHETPEACKSLSNRQIEWAEAYFESLSVKYASTSTKYPISYGYTLRQDYRIKLYLKHLREIADAVNVVSKGQMIGKLGQRFLSKSIDNSDLAKISRELRTLQGLGSDMQINQQINIKLPDTYNQFVKPNDTDNNSARLTEDWENND